MRAFIPSGFRRGVACALVLCVALAVVTAAKAQDPVAEVVKKGEAASLARDYIREIEIYSAALQAGGLSDLDRRDLLRLRAFAHEWAKKFTEAEADWKAALAIEPVEPALYYKRGFFFERRARYDEALADFAKAKSLDPKKVAEKIHSGMKFKTVIGEMSYDKKGDITRPDYVMYVWKKDASGKITYVEIDNKGS